MSCSATETTMATSTPAKTMNAAAAASINQHNSTTPNRGSRLSNFIRRASPAGCLKPDMVYDEDENDQQQQDGTPGRGRQGGGSGGGGPLSPPDAIMDGQDQLEELARVVPALIEDMHQEALELQEPAGKQRIENAISFADGGDDDGGLLASPPGRRRGLLGGARSPPPSSSRKKKKGRTALRRAYDLCDAKHKHNRIPLVCSTKYDLVTALVRRLVNDGWPANYGPPPSSSVGQGTEGGKENNQPPYVPSTSRAGGSSSDVHLAVLALNNLSIPFENKAVMALGPAAPELLQGLLTVIRQERSEAYLCCIVLMNLSFLEDAQSPLLRFAPADGNGRTGKAGGGAASGYCDPLDHPYSLIRTLERYLSKHPRMDYTRVSMDGESVRWICGLVRNLSRKHEDSALLAETMVPIRLVGYVRDATSLLLPVNSPKRGGGGLATSSSASVMSPTISGSGMMKLSDWTQDSLQDSALSALCNFARWKESRMVLRRADAHEAVRPLIGLGGIHDFRANMIVACLEQVDDPDVTASQAATSPISSYEV